jgi:hypothetical protein
MIVGILVNKYGWYQSYFMIGTLQNKIALIPPTQYSNIPIFQYSMGQIYRYASDPDYSQEPKYIVTSFVAPTCPIRAS